VHARVAKSVDAADSKSAGE